MRPEPNTPPTFIAEALENAMRADPEARWSDTLIFARAVWDALHEHGADCRFMPAERYVDEVTLETNTPGFPHGYLGAHDDGVIWRPEFLRVLVVPLDASPEPHA